MPAPDAAGAPRRTYAVREQHRNSWGWKVSAYLWTKSLAAGAFLVPAVLASGLPWREPVPSGALLMALLALATTGALLVADLRQPARFLWTLTRPQWRSWLTRGSYVIAAYGLALSRAARPRPRAAPGAAASSPASPRSWPRAPRSTRRCCSARPRDATSGSRALLGPAPPRAGADRRRRPLRAVLAALPPARQRPARRGRGVGPPRHRGRAPAARLIQDDPRFTTGVLVLGHLLPLSILWGPSGAAACWPRP